MPAAADNQALEAAFERIRQVVVGQVPKAPSVSFREAAESWLAEGRTRWTPATRRDYEALLGSPDRPRKPRGRPSRARLMRALGDVPASEIGRQHVVALLADLQAAGLGPQSARKHVLVIRAILRHAGVELDVAKPASRRTGRPVLTLKQVGLVERHAHELLKPMIRVAALTGVRQGELRALQVGDVNLSERWLYVRRAFSAGRIGLPKSGRERQTPICDELAELLAELTEGRRAVEPVLPGPTGAPASPTWVRTRWLRALESAQQLDPSLPRSDWHGLRRTWATTLVARSVPLPTIQRWGGWADLSTLQRYLGPALALSVPAGLAEGLRMAA